jgi:anti-sigma factor RsiW
VILDSDECPADREETAEAYVMGTLTEKQAVAFEDHYAVCEACAAVLQRTAEYVDAMHVAAADFEPQNVLKMVARTGNS